MDLTFEWFGFSSPQMEAALDIRTRVFVDEQGYTLEEDRDEQDRTALHVLGRGAAGEPVCTARMFEEQPGVWHIGRVATYAARRGRGYAGAMMREMCREAAARGGKTASLGAQVERQSFYAPLRCVLPKAALRGLCTFQTGPAAPRAGSKGLLLAGKYPGKVHKPGKGSRMAER